MRRRLLALLTSGVLVGGLALVAAPAEADPTLPPVAQYWPTCTGPTDPYCVESVQRNGVTIPPEDLDQTTGVEPVVSTLGSGTVSFTVYDFDQDPDSLDVPPSDTWRIVVRTGSIRPREMYGVVRDPSFAASFVSGTGWKFAITFRPSPINWVGFGDGRTCIIGACGDDTWKASLSRAGFANGYVTNLVGSGLSSAEISQRTGMISAYNAQDANTFFDPDSNSLVVQLANPHLTATGALATGTYETFLPTAFLTGSMHVPDPSSLSAGTFTVVRTSGSSVSSAPFTLTHVPGGIRIRITGITYSSPTYKIKPGPSKPRKVSATKISAHKARVRFTKPAKNLGYKINRYQARCHKLGKPWRKAKGTASPITVGNLPKGKVYCQVRAHNKLGWGVWSATKRT